MDTAIRVLQKIKIEAINLINETTKVLITKPNTKPDHLHSAYIDPNTIQASIHPFSHLKEEQLENNPVLKLKKAILIANTEQLQRTNQQLKNNINKQLSQDNDLQR